jgi:hypothetical protein
MPPLNKRHKSKMQEAVKSDIELSIPFMVPDLAYKFLYFRQKDLELFLDHTRMKFVGFQVKNDQTSLAGLPRPIHEGVKVLKQVRIFVTLTFIELTISGTYIRAWIITIII